MTCGSESMNVIAEAFLDMWLKESFREKYFHLTAKKNA